MNPPADIATDRLATDRFLRWHDWRIQSRPKRGPALWRRGELIRTDREAVALVLAELKRAEEAEQAGGD